MARIAARRHSAAYASAAAARRAWGAAIRRLRLLRMSRQRVAPCGRPRGLYRHATAGARSRLILWRCAHWPHARGAAQDPWHCCVDYPSPALEGPIGLSQHGVDVGMAAVELFVLALNSCASRQTVALQPSAALALRRAPNSRRGRPRSAAQEAAGYAVHVGGESAATAGAAFH